MSEHAVFTDNNDVDQEGFGRVLEAVFSSGVFGTTDWAVSERGAGANMSVDIAVGRGLFEDDLGFLTFAYSTDVFNVAISAADATNPRKSIIVAWEDKSVTGTTNGVSRLTFMEVSGAPAGSPSDPSDGDIQTAVGAGNPFIKLARVDVAANATEIEDADITSLRTLVSPYAPASQTLTTPTIITPTMQGIWDGWIAANETWSYASATTFTCSASMAANLSVGDKIKLTQTTAKYFYVIGISGTTITVTGGTDYTLANAAITSPYYSKMTSPVGFPQWFTYTPTMSAASGGFVLGNGALTGKFQLVGKMCHVTVEYGHGSSGVNSGSGIWRWALPITPYYTAQVISNIGVGNAYIEDIGSIAYIGQVKIVNYNTSPNASFTILYANNASVPSQGGSLTGTAPFTFASQDFIAFSASYQIA